MKILISSSGLREPLATPKNLWGSRYFVWQGFEGFWSNFIENEWALLTGKKQVRALAGYNAVRVSFSTAKPFHRFFVIGLIGNSVFASPATGGTFLSPILCNRTYWKQLASDH